MTFDRGYDRLISTLDKWRDQRCWSVVVGIGTGSNFTLDAGDHIQRARPLTNAQLSPIQRSYRGKFDIYVTTGWRLQHRDEVVCTWLDADDHLGLVFKALQALVGQTITSARTANGCLDLVVTFDNDNELIIFCDQSIEDKDQCYSFTLDGGRTRHIAENAFQARIEMNVDSEA